MVVLAADASLGPGRGTDSVESVTEAAARAGGTGQPASVRPGQAAPAAPVIREEGLPPPASFGIYDYGERSQRMARSAPLDSALTEPGGLFHPGPSQRLTVTDTNGSPDSP
jgi:hypothetical protein